MRFLELVRRLDKPTAPNTSGGAGPPQPELSVHDLVEMLPAFASGELEMTEAILLQLIEFTNPYVGPDGWNEDECESWHDEWMERWIIHANPQWLDVLIGILSKPADWWVEIFWNNGNPWLDCLEEWLVAIASKDPEASIHKLAATMPSMHERLRPNLITAVGSIGDPGGLMILDHILAEASLPPDVVKALAMALAELGGEQSLERLTELVAALDAGRKCHGAPYFVLKAREEAHRQLDRAQHLT